MCGADGRKNGRQDHLAASSKPYEIGSALADKAIRDNNKSIEHQSTQSLRSLGKNQIYSLGLDLEETAEDWEINLCNSWDNESKRIKKTNPVQLNMDEKSANSYDKITNKAFLYHADEFGLLSTIVFFWCWAMKHKDIWF